MNAIPFTHDLNRTRNPFEPQQLNEKMESDMNMEFDMTRKPVIPVCGEFIHDLSRGNSASRQFDEIRNHANRNGRNPDMVHERISGTGHNRHGGAKLICESARTTGKSVAFEIPTINKYGEAAEFTLWLPRFRIEEVCAGEWILDGYNSESPYEFHVVPGWKQELVFHRTQVQALINCSLENTEVLKKPITTTRWKSVFDSDDNSVEFNSGNYKDAMGSIPQFEPTSVPEQASAPEPTLFDKLDLVDEPTLFDQPIPVDKSVSVDEPISNDEPTLFDKTASVDESTPVNEPIPVDKSASVDESAIMMTSPALEEIAEAFEKNQDEYFYLVKTSPNATATRIDCVTRKVAEMYAAHNPAVKEILEYRNGRIDADAYQAINGWQWMEMEDKPA